MGWVERQKTEAWREDEKRVDHWVTDRREKKGRHEKQFTLWPVLQISFSLMVELCPSSWWRSSCCLSTKSQQLRSNVHEPTLHGDEVPAYSCSLPAGCTSTRKEKWNQTCVQSCSSSHFYQSSVISRAQNWGAEIPDSQLIRHTLSTAFFGRIGDWKMPP